jgi:hypothetical protein
MIFATQAMLLPHVLNPSNLSWGDPAMGRIAEKSSHLTQAEGYRRPKPLPGASLRH